MNRYARRAQQYWREFLPTRYAQIDNPVEYFTHLGEQMSTEINLLALRLAGNDPTGESYLAKVGRLRMARLQAEEQIIRETLPEGDDQDQQTDQ